MIHFHDLGPGVLPDPTQSKLVHKMIGFNSRENLNKSIEILKDCGADGWVEKYEKELASL